MATEVAAGAVAEAGGVAGCDLERTTALRHWARRHLATVQQQDVLVAHTTREQFLPTIAVVITCHNYGQFLADAIQSVLDQSLRPQEILVIDDSSTDDTGPVAARFEQAGVAYRRVEHRSVFRARRPGLEATESEILCFLDADDLLPGDYLERGVPLFGSPEIGLVYSDIELFWERTGREIQPEFDRIAIDRNNFMHAGSLVRRRALEIADAFRGPDIVDAHEDWLVWRRVIDAGWTGVKQSGVYWYRKHWKQLPSRSDQLRGDYFAPARCESWMSRSSRLSPAARVCGLSTGSG